jgi:hypothetical protein
MELFGFLDRKLMMSNLSPPSRAPGQPASPLDHQGGLSLWLRTGVFALLLLAAARPDRWAWSLPSLHAVFLGLFAYSILGELAAGALALLAPIAIFIAAIVLLCFDRAVYVPTYRLARYRFNWSALAAFSLAVIIEGAVAGGLIFGVYHHRHVTATGSEAGTLRNGVDAAPFSSLVVFSRRP